MTSDEKKRIGAVLRHFPKGTKYHVDHYPAGRLRLTVDTTTLPGAALAVEKAAGVLTFAGEGLASGTWEGDPLDEVLPRGKWVEATAEALAASGRAWHAGDRVFTVELLRRGGSDPTPDEIRSLCDTRPSEGPAVVTHEMVQLAAEQWDKAHGKTTIQMVRAMLEAALACKGEK